MRSAEQKLIEKPVAEFITKIPGVAEHYPIVPAKQMIPRWFKDMSPRLGNEPHVRSDPVTVKMCPGIVDELSAGWIMQTWCDIVFTSTSDRELTWVMPPDVPPLGLHEDNQTEGMPFKPGHSRFLLKFENVWVCKTKPGYSMLVRGIPHADEDLPFEIISGVVGTDTYHQLSIVVRYRKTGQGELIVPAGTPLCHLIPVRTADLKMECVVRESATRYDELFRQGRGGVGPSGTRLVLGAYRSLRRKIGADNVGD